MPHIVEKIAPSHTSDCVGRDVVAKGFAPIQLVSTWWTSSTRGLRLGSATHILRTYHEIGNFNLRGVPFSRVMSYK
jgi:hypothetical protein